MIFFEKNLKTSSTIYRLLCCLLVVSSFVLGQDETITYSDDILNWQTPEDMIKKLPYYLSGYKDGVPVWVIEAGKMDIRSYFEEGGNSQELLKFAEQMITRFASPELYKEKEDGEAANTFIVISDMDGYSTRQLTHIPTVSYTLTSTKMFVDILNKKNMKFKRAFIVNSNFVFQSMWTLMKPVLGQMASEMELFGTNVDKWKPVLINEIGKEQLPEFLGGAEDHKFIQTFG